MALNNNCVSIQAEADSTTQDDEVPQVEPLPAGVVYEAKLQLEEVQTSCALMLSSAMAEQTEARRRLQAITKERAAVEWDLKMAKVQRDHGRKNLAFAKNNMLIWRGLARGQPKDVIESVIGDSMTQCKILKSQVAALRAELLASLRAKDAGAGPSGL